MVRMMRLRLMMSRDLNRHDGDSGTHTLPAVDSKGSGLGGDAARLEWVGRGGICANG